MKKQWDTTQEGFDRLLSWLADNRDEAGKKYEMIRQRRVKEIRPATAVELAPQGQRISEHNPEWQEAIVEVQETLKGPAGASEIVVRFPASQDIMWVGYPKLKAGQESRSVVAFTKNTLFSIT